MNRAELYARFHLYGKNIEVIDADEFRASLEGANKHNFNHHQPTANVEVQTMYTDGMDYYSFGVVYSVGWEGEHDCDSFTCKVKCLTDAEMNEFANIFTKVNNLDEAGAIGDDNYYPHSEETSGGY